MEETNDSATLKNNRIIYFSLDELGQERLEQFVRDIQLEQKKEEAAHLKILTTALRDFAYGDILKTLEANTLMAVPILCTCFIEQMATFRYGKDITNKEFMLFVQQYLTQYDAISLRNDLRNKLVHNYSIGDTYVIISGYRQFHLQRSKGDQKVIINVENLVEDLGLAMETFLKEIETDPQIRKIAFTALEKFQVVHFIPGSK